MLSKLKLILDELFRIWCGWYQPMQLLPLGGFFIAHLSLLFLDLCRWQHGRRLLPACHAKACVYPQGFYFNFIWPKSYDDWVVTMVETSVHLPADWQCTVACTTYISQHICRALTRKLQLGLSGPNWESERSEHACVSAPKCSWVVQVALWTPLHPQQGS